MTIKEMAMMTILDEAKALVNGQRQTDYGPIADSFRITAERWSLIVNAQITAQEVALCMAELKMVRQSFRAKRDNLVDAVAYLYIASLLEESGDGLAVPSIDAEEGDF